MKIEGEKFLFNAAIKYLGKYPATKKKVREYLTKELNKKKTYQKSYFPENFDKKILVNNIVSKLDNLKIIDEGNYLESMFNYYQKSLFSIRKIKNKLYHKGFDKKKIEEHISSQLIENPDLEIIILKKYILKKNLRNLELHDLKKKLYQQSFSEETIYKVIKE